MSDILELYRGDYEKIREMDFKKTNKWCLVGQGIYLTNSKQVAETYRDKGSDDCQEILLFNDKAVNKNIAMQAAYNKFVEKKWKAVSKLPLNKNSKNFIAFEKTMRDVWYVMNEREEIIINRDYSEQEKLSYFDIKIKGPKVGYLTTFRFPKAEMEAGLFNVDDTKFDPKILELIYEKQLFAQRNLFSLDKKNKEDRFKSFEEVRHHALWYGLNSLRLDHNKLAMHLKPMGYIGYEYNGGTYMSASKGKLHRAFSIWDSDFVNTHKISRQR